MTVLAAVLLPALELEDNEFLAATLCDDLTFDLGTRHERSAELRAVSAEEEDLFERHPISGGTIQFFNAKNVAGRDPVLFSAGANDCVCHGEGPRKLNAITPGRKDQSPISRQEFCSIPLFFRGDLGYARSGDRRFFYKFSRLCPGCPKTDRRLSRGADPARGPGSRLGRPDRAGDPSSGTLELPPAPEPAGEAGDLPRELDFDGPWLFSKRRGAETSRDLLA